MKQVLHSAVTGFNDTVAPSELKNNECRILINVDLDESGGAETRPGFSKVNPNPLGYEVEQEFEWLVSSTSRKLAVMNNKVYLVNNDGTLTEKLAIANSEIDIITIQNVLYIMDGSEIYEWGKYDYSAIETAVSIALGDIIYNMPASSGGGVEKKFYKAKAGHGTTNLSTENFANTTKWEDVTDIAGVISSVIRPVKPYNGGVKEKVKITINYMAEVAGNVTVTLNGIDKSVAIAANDTATQIAGKIRSATYTGWTTSGSGNVVYIESTTEGSKTNAYYDPGATGAYGTILTETEGASNDNNLDSVKRCRIFEQHSLSKRIFAAGDPENPTAIYYSEPNQLNYWKEHSELYPTTPEAKAISLLALDSVMLVGFSNSWWYWAGITAGIDALWKQLPIPYGPISHGSVVATPFSFTFTSKTGVYTVQSSILSQEALMIQSDRMIIPLSENKVDKTIKSIAKPNLAKAIYHDNKYMLAYCDDGLLTRNNKVLIYNENTKGFVKWEGVQVNHWNVTTGYELRVASKNFIIYQDTNKQSDIDVVTGENKAIKTHIRTKDFDLGYPLGLKFVYFVHLLMKQYESVLGSVANVSLIGDYMEKIFEDVSLEESLVWGRTWGSVWGWIEMMEFEAEIKHKASRFALEIKDETLGNKVGFYGVGFSFIGLRPEGNTINDGMELINS